MAAQSVGSGVPASTVAAYMSKQWESSLYANFALYDMFKDKGAVRAYEGGDGIRAPLLLTAGTQAYITGPTSWITRANSTTALTMTINEANYADYPWSMLVDEVVIPMHDILQNRGTPKMLDVVEGYTQQTIERITQALVTQLFAGRTTGAFDGLKVVVNYKDTALWDDFGGIDGDAYSTTWMPVRVSNAGNALQIRAANSATSMEYVMLKCARGGSRPNLIVCDLGTYQSFTSLNPAPGPFGGPPAKADSGYAVNPTFMGATVVADENCPAYTMLFLNTRYLWLAPHSSLGNNGFDVGAEDVPSDKRASYYPVTWYGTLVCNNRRAQGIIENIGGSSP